MYLEATFVALDVWPHGDEGQEFSRFKATWTNVLKLMDRELRMLDAAHVILGTGHHPRDIRKGDGWPRGDARSPRFPGVEISFDSRHGHLTYRTARFNRWEANLQAIALSLEALRKVERYGVATGQQYAGWKQLPASSAMAHVPTDATAAWGVLARVLGRDPVALHIAVKTGNEALDSLVRAAAKRAHPDQGGTNEAFQAVDAARRILVGAR